MPNDWREQLQKVRERLTGLRVHSAGTKHVQDQQKPLGINLGIDFGTSFTKVCFRDVGTEESGIVTFGGANVADVLIPSVVAVDKAETLYGGSPDAKLGPGKAVRYLKMRLAGLNYDEPHLNGGIDLNDPVICRALASWYLARVIRNSQEWILKQEHSRAKGRPIQWSANVGVPVEHYDSPAIDVFRTVLGVAWIWANGRDIPERLNDALSYYPVTAKRLTTEPADCHAIPEISAAVQSFIISRDAQPGVYVYFDIGGGTLDGVLFKFLNKDGSKYIDFYSAKVEALGSAVIGNAINLQNSEEIESALVTNNFRDSSMPQVREFVTKVQRQVAFVIMTGKEKDTRDWRREFFQDRSRRHRSIAMLDPSDKKSLIIFLGGAGAGSKWYQRSILDTHHNFGHWGAGIPPYDLAEVPVPRDLNIYGLTLHDFRRFAIAYGLSVPYGEGPEIHLPSQFPPEGSTQKARMRTIIDYEDTKDAYC